MRKEFAIFTVLILISTATAIQKEKINGFSVNKDIRSFQTTQKSNFQVEINSPNSIFLLSKEGLEQEIERSGKAAWTIDNTKINGNRYWISGFRFPGSYLIFNESEIIAEEEYQNALDWAEFVGNNVILSRSIQGTEYQNLAGETFWLKSFSHGREIPIGNSSNTNNFLLSTKGGSVYRTGENGVIEKLEISSSARIGAVDIGNSTLFWSNNLLQLEDKWSLEVPVKSKPVIRNKKNQLLHYDGEKLVRRSLSTGQKIDQKPLSADIYNLKYLEEQDLIVGVQGGNLSVFSGEGEKLDSWDLGIEKGIQKTEYDQDGEMEIAVGKEEEVEIFELKRDRKMIGDLSNTVFVGTGREALKAVASNRTVLVAEEYSEVKHKVEEMNKTPVGIGEVKGLEKASNLDGKLEKDERYYAEDREKLVYVSVLASLENASLTFRRSEATRSFENRSVEDLRELLIEKMEPHHVTVADLDSDRGILAAYMAVKQGSLPVDFDHEVNYPEKEELEDDGINPEEWNRYNGVIKLEEEIESVFEEIGENGKTVFDGKYISILDGPRKLYRDPVDQGFFKDPSDGKYFFSDIGYGNLDSDSRLEASVGRYPSDLEKASLMFRRSLEREKGETALVMGEYLHSNWPTVLATLGGGMRDTKTLEHILKDQGYETEVLAERRAQPVKLLYDLLGAPTKMDSAISSVKSSQDKLGGMIGESSVKMLKNGLMVVRGLSYAEEALETFLEFKWSEWEPLNQELDFPDSASLEEFNGLVRSFLPNRYGRLSVSNIREGIGDADIIHYEGVGNKENWVLPNNSTGWIKDRYNGSRTFEPSMIPEMENTVVLDNSNHAGSRNSEMRESFLDKGASNFVGWSSVNYNGFSSIVSQTFYRKGKTVGNGLVEGLNDLKAAEMFFNPTSSMKSGIREKMSSSIELYGNPETFKDPVTEEGLNVSKNCSEGICELAVKLRPEYKIKSFNGSETVIFDADSYILEPGLPITPLYTEDFPVGKAEIEEVSVETDLKKSDSEPKVFRALSHGTQFLNVSRNFSEFPEETVRVNGSGDGVQVGIAGQKFSGNKTNIVEEAEISVRYRSPVTAELVKDGRTASLEVFSDRDRNVTLGVRTEGEIETRKIRLDKGETKLSLGKLERGENRFEVRMYSEKVLGEASRTFHVRSPLELYVFAPDIRKGHTRKVRAVVKNPNDREVTEDLVLKTSGKVQPAFLESREREVAVDGGSEAEVAWKVTGIEKGAASVKVNEGSENISVEDATDSLTRIGSSVLRDIVSGRSSEFTERRTSQDIYLRLETSMGLALYSKNSSMVLEKIKTDSFKAVRKRSPERKLIDIRSPNGQYTLIEENGVSNEKGDRSLRGHLETLETEMQKLKERSDHRAK